MDVNLSKNFSRARAACNPRRVFASDFGASGLHAFGRVLFFQSVPTGKLKVRISMELRSGFMPVIPLSVFLHFFFLEDLGKKH